MRMRVVLPMVLALVAGLAALAVIGSIRKGPQIPQQKLVVVVVAKGDLMALSKLGPEMLTELRMSPAVVPAGAFTSKDELIGRVLKTDIPDKYAITEAFLAPKGALSGLQGKIPPGYRARAIRIDEVTAVGGFVEVGSHVDIVATSRSTKDDQARTILKNVKVLAVGQRMTEEDTSDGNTRGRPKEQSVTLLLTPDEVKVIATHEANGDRLTLSLRSGEEEPGDSEQVIPQAPTETQAQKAPETEKVEVEKPQRFTQTVIRGDQEILIIYEKINGQWCKQLSNGRYEVVDPSEFSTFPKLKKTQAPKAESADDQPDEQPAPEAQEASYDPSESDDADADDDSDEPQDED